MWRLNARLAVLIGAGGLLAYSLAVYHPPHGLHEGEIAPGFELPLEGGQTWSYPKFAGHRAVLINFWATWCPPCIREMPSLEVLSRRLPDRLVVVGISLDESSKGLEAFRRRVDVTFPILLDAEGSVAELYGTDRLPESYLIDSHGILVKKYSGPRDWADAGLIDEILRLIATRSNDNATER